MSDDPIATLPGSDDAQIRLEIIDSGHGTESDNDDEEDIGMGDIFPVALISHRRVFPHH